MRKWRLETCCCRPNLPPHCITDSVQFLFSFPALMSHLVFSIPTFLLDIAGTYSKNGVLWGEFGMLVRKLQEKIRLESCDLSFFRNKDLLLACVSVPLRCSAVYWGLLIMAPCCHSIKCLNCPLHLSRVSMLVPHEPALVIVWGLNPLGLYLVKFLTPRV